jgi:protein subunit release factor B
MAAYIGGSKREALVALMERVGVREDDLDEKFILGSGKGGQKVNKTSSCVYLKHLPTGREIKCQSARSRELNRYHARRELCELMEEEQLGRASRRRQEIEKIRRQKRRRSRRQKQRMLDDKKHQSDKKKQRRPIGSDD